MTPAAYGDLDGHTQVVTAFRTAEKKYQLHLEQTMRYRGGRMRGGKLVPQPTDLSAVIDIRDPSAVGADASIQSHQLQPSINQQCVCCLSLTREVDKQQPLSEASQIQGQQCQFRHDRSVTALTFSHHPGLTVFPAALCPLQQLQLMQAALGQWPEAPTTTNHTKQHGLLPHGLFKAAQAGLVLAQQSTSQQQQAQRSVEHGMVQSAVQQPAGQGGYGPTAEPADQGCQHTSSPCSIDFEQLPAEGSSTDPGSSHHGTAAVWAADTKGVKASVLLRKLRWVSLGPPFNWTDRVYQRDVQHLPLPQELVNIACHHAALTASVSDRNSQCAAAVQDAALDAVDPATSPAQGPTAAAFVPDVALVNYYHAGDTLGGHKDDVEPDMTQPIVTMSLGCEAVFLMGGSSREVTPTALLLRSGDVVVLAGPSRSCYHGLPRIFTDKHLPMELLAAAAQHQQYQPYLEYFKQCRVNVSVRCTV